MIGNRLKSLRGKRTQQETADKLGVSRASYSHYENNHVQPDNEMIIKMADHFKVSTDYILGKDQRDSAEKLIDYLEMELTNEEIKERMTFKVDDITLSSEEVDEFVDWVRVQRLMKKQRSAALSKSEGP